MPSAWITKSTTSEIQVSGSHRRTYDLLIDARFQDADKTKVAAVLKEAVQADLETVIRVRDLPDDEPYGPEGIDPAPEFGERFFWRGRGSNKELVARDTIVESCVWMPPVGQDTEGRFHFVVRDAR